MTEYKRLGNYLLFEETNADSMGTNFRTGELENDKVKDLKILSEVHPLLYQKPKLWKRVVLLLEGIRKSNISGLYSPDKILSMGEKQMLVFPFIHYKNFDSILEDSAQKNIPINFDLAFSIAIAIADLLDVGSSIVISGKKSFHGSLTPDNIFIDFEGKIYLKNYGICPYLDKDEEIFSTMEKQYGSWLAPEFIRRENILPQSDIFHLGYLLFKMLTGKYFSYSEGEDFEAKLASISFSQHIHDTNKDYINGLIEFFKKTLNPDPKKRFANSKEFKDYISSTFHVEELSSVTFNLAYFMDSLYGKSRDEELTKFRNEKQYVPPVKKVTASGPAEVDSQLVETILEGLDNAEKGGKSKLYYIIGAILIVAVATIVFIFIQSGQAKKAEQSKQEQARILEQKNQREQELLKRLKAVEEQNAATEEEKKKQEEDRQKLLDELDKEKKEKERLKKIEADVQKKAEDDKKLKEEAEKKKKDEEALKLKIAEDEKKKKDEAERKKKALEALKPKLGELVAIQAVDKKPQKVSGKSPVFPPSIRSRYRGNKFEARVMCLIDENGSVVSTRVLSSIPKEIKKTIEKSIQKWKFTSATKMGVRVKVWHSLPLKISI
ncbi:MAG: protein kinase [Acidobacteriota bacterium]